MAKPFKNILFQMPGFQKQSIINGHVFYIKQTKNLLIKQFDELNRPERQIQVINEWLSDNQHRFNPDYHDSSDFYDEAFEQLLALTELGEQIRLSIAAGMYHAWEKQLKNWMIKELRHWHSGEKVVDAFQKNDFSQLIDLFESLGWSVKDNAYCHKINECRLVANVYKHGDGTAFNELKKNYPEYLSSAYNSNSPNDRLFYYIDHESLRVSNDQLDVFSNAIISFWENVPENIYDHDDVQIPKWLSSAFARDAASKEE